MDELDEQIKLARMGAFKDGATQMEEQQKIAKCTCAANVPPWDDHALHCPVSVWGRAAKILLVLKASEEANGDRFDNDAEGVAV